MTSKLSVSRSTQYALEKARDEIRQVLEISAARWAEGLAEGEIKGEIKGEVKAKAWAILAILAARDVPVSHEVRARIEACKDTASLDQWIVRAATAASAEEIFSERG